MNSDAKSFILQINKGDLRNTFKLAFSCKVERDSVVTDRVCIIYHEKKLDDILYLMKLITDNEKIEMWVKDVFRLGKTVIFSFTENTRKMYIENKGNIRTSKYLNESIEWEVGNEDNFRNRNYLICRRNPEDYRYLISPELYPFLNFNQCLLRTDDNVYIRSTVKNGMINPFTRDIGCALSTMFFRFQPEYTDENLIKFNNWLLNTETRKMKFNWIQVNNDNFTVYVC